MNGLRTVFVLEAKQRLLELFVLFKVVNQYSNSGEENHTDVCYYHRWARYGLVLENESR